MCVQGLRQRFSSKSGGPKVKTDQDGGNFARGCIRGFCSGVYTKWVGFYEIMLCAAFFPGSSVVKSCIFTAFRNPKTLVVCCVRLP